MLFILRIFAFLALPITVGGMKRWGFRSCEPINRYELYQRVMRLINHLIHNIL